MTEAMGKRRGGILVKKLIGLLTACGLALCALTGCSGGGQDAAEPAETAAIATEEPTQMPQEELPVVEDVLLEQPTVAPVEALIVSNATAQPTQTPQPANDFSTYTFARLSDTSFGFTFEYPAQWTNLPGRYTVCYREPVEEGEFPARVAVTRKATAHTPSSRTLLQQFYNYAEQIRAQYDSSTFEYGELNSEASFMGETGYSITYLAYSGDIEVEGYMVCCAIGRAIYVFHFCASYDDYQAMSSIMTRMRDSVAVAE